MKRVFYLFCIVISVFAILTFSEKAVMYANMSEEWLCAVNFLGALWCVYSLGYWINLIMTNCHDDDVCFWEDESDDDENFPGMGLA